MIPCNILRRMFYYLCWIGGKPGSCFISGSTKGKRYVLPNSGNDAPAPWGTKGQAVDIDIQAKEILRLRESLNKFYLTIRDSRLSVLPGTSTGIFICRLKWL